jgi:ParB family chromosome partitioning protein
MATSENKSRLGRGLASLIGDTTGITAPVIEPVNVVAPPPVAVAREEGHKLVPIDKVCASPFNPRKSFSPIELDELASSIKQRGVVQPLIVRPAPEGNGNELVERFGYNQEELAKIIGKSRSHLTNTLRLLKLPQTVQTLVREGAISAGHARALIGNDYAEKIARMIVEKGLSVRQVEEMVKETNKNSKDDDDVMTVHDTDTLAVEKELADTLGLIVNIRKGKGQSGEIRVKYKTLDQFDDLYLRLMQKYTT